MRCATFGTALLILTANAFCAGVNPDGMVGHPSVGLQAGYAGSQDIGGYYSQCSFTVPISRIVTLGMNHGLAKPGFDVSYLGNLQANIYTRRYREGTTASNLDGNGGVRFSFTGGYASLGARGGAQAGLQLTHPVSPALSVTYGYSFEKLGRTSVHGGGVGFSLFLNNRPQELVSYKPYGLPGAVSIRPFFGVTFAGEPRVPVSSGLIASLETTVAIVTHVVMLISYGGTFIQNENVQVIVAGVSYTF